MKFFLLFMGTVLAVGGLFAVSSILFSKVNDAKTAFGRTLLRIGSGGASIAAVLLLLWIIDTQTAPESGAVNKPNPIAELDRQAAEDAADIERPVLESKTYRERVRAATTQD